MFHALYSRQMDWNDTSTLTHLVKPHEEELLDPVIDREVHGCDGVEERDARGEGEADEQSRHELCVVEGEFYLRSHVELIQIVLSEGQTFSLW